MSANPYPPAERPSSVQLYRGRVRQQTDRYAVVVERTTTERRVIETYGTADADDPEGRTVNAWETAEDEAARSPGGWTVVGRSYGAVSTTLIESDIGGGDDHD